ncbi:MAG: metallophosphoesterase family protein [Gemmataceae bacterium]|nr:metallophosphoesterase family protein [Gemmataceae bacterium]
MTSLHRRGFLGAAALAAGSVPRLFARDLPPPREIGPADPGPGLGTPAGLDTLFLTYKGDPTTSATVQWLGTDPAADGTVRYVTPEGVAWKTAPARKRPFPRTDYTLFRADLSGLAPGTDYLFQVAGHRKTFKFRTAPAKATDTFTFVSGGDCGVNPHVVANNLLAAKQDPYFALIGGDLGYDNGRSAKTAIAFLQNYSRTMVDGRGRLIPLVAAVGNHEVDGGYAKPRANAPFFLALFDGLYPDHTYATLDFGDYLSLVLLDTGHVEPIGGAQADWLETALEDRQGRPHLIAACHVPAYPSYRNPDAGKDGAFGTGEGNRLHWCPLFERLGVDAVLEHHDHAFKRTFPLTDGLRDRNGVVYLGDGSWGQLRAPVAPEKRPYLAEVGKAYQVSVHRLEGPDRFHLALAEGGRVEDVYFTGGKRPARRG